MIIMLLWVKEVVRFLPTTCEFYSICMTSAWPEREPAPTTTAPSTPCNIDGWMDDVWEVDACGYV
jgi:hypothetical protein